MNSTDQHHESGLDLGFSEGGGLSLRRIAIVLGVAFVIALGIVVGKRMSSDAIAITVGVGVGILASLPALLLLLVTILVLGRQRHPQEPADWQPNTRSYPPVVVVQGSTPPQLQSPGYWPAPSVAQNDYEPAPGYRVLGED